MPQDSAGLMSECMSEVKMEYSEQDSESLSLGDQDSMMLLNNSQSNPFFGKGSENDINSSQQSNASSITLSVRKLMMRVGSQGSMAESDNELLDCSQNSQSSIPDIDSLFKLDKDLDITPPELPAKANSDKFIVPQATTVPRCTTPCEGWEPPRSRTPDLTPDQSGRLNLVIRGNQVTPQKPGEDDGEDPWTPTANLKMLISAASPEIRNRDRLKMMSRLEEQSASEEELEVLPLTSAKKSRKVGAGQKRKVSMVRDCREDLMGQLEQEADLDLSPTGCTSRKEKSLGLLCQRFLARYPHVPGPLDNFELCLDEVAKDLGVERRRIYDIVNVLESVEIVSRVAKNKYAWHGHRNLQHTLAKLKALAKKEGFHDYIQSMKDYEITKNLKCDTSVGPVSTSSPRKNPKSQGCVFQEGLRKDRSLGIMSQRFLMLFLVSAPKTVNLDLSAKILVGEPGSNKQETAKFKTKIRRLYDIANILTSLNLIKKVHVTEVRGRKPAFKYVGPEIQDIENISVCNDDGCHRPSSRHSLLDCIQNPQVCSLLNNGKVYSLPPPPSNKHSSFLVRSKSFCTPTASGIEKDPHNSDKKTLFSRHASFEQICEVASQEHNKLSQENNSPYFQSATRKMTSHATIKVISTQNARSKPGVATSPDESKASVPSSSSPCLPDISTSSKSTPASSLETVLLKAHRTPGNESPSGTPKRPTVITLTRDQLDAVLQQLRSQGQGQSGTVLGVNSTGAPRKIVVKTVGKPYSPQAAAAAKAQTAKQSPTMPAVPTVINVQTTSGNTQNRNVSRATPKRPAETQLTANGKRVKISATSQQSSVGTAVPRRNIVTLRQGAGVAMPQRSGQTMSPTLHLSGASSPVLLLPPQPHLQLAAPVPATPSIIIPSIQQLSAATPVLNAVSMVNGINHTSMENVAAPLVTTQSLLSGQKIASMQFSRSTISPLCMAQSSMVGVPQLPLSTTIGGGAILTPTYPSDVTPTGIRPGAFRTISSGSSNIINLMPFLSSPSSAPPLTACPTFVNQRFAATPKDTTTAVSASLLKPNTTNNNRFSPITTSLLTTPTTQIFVTPNNTGCTPTYTYAASTPTTGMVLNAQSLATPGTFFRSTPSVHAAASYPSSSLSALGVGGSAFKIVDNRLVAQTCGDATIPTVRRLQLAHNDQ